MEDFSIRRVEPGEELRRDEVQIPRIPALKEPGSERPVVPGRVEAGHSRGQLRLDVDSELDHCDSGDRQCDQGWRQSRGSLNSTPSGRTGVSPSRSGVLFFAPLTSSDGRQTPWRKTQQARGMPPSSPNPQPKSQADHAQANEIRHWLERPKAAKDLRDPDQEHKRDHPGRQVRWRTPETREQA